VLAIADVCHRTQYYEQVVEGSEQSKCFQPNSYRNLLPFRPSSQLILICLFDFLVYCDDLLAPRANNKLRTAACLASATAYWMWAYSQRSMSGGLFLPQREDASFHGDEWRNKVKKTVFILRNSEGLFWHRCAICNRVFLFYTAIQPHLLIVSECLYV
jgi:hypothetical protein